MISVVVPTLNAERSLAATLAALVPGLVDGLIREAVVVDGGSTDATVAIAEGAGCRVVTSPPGRGVQLAEGCAAARGDWFLILHADTRLTGRWIEAVHEHVELNDRYAAYFRLRFDDVSAAARVWERAVAVRNRLWWPYGDQGLLIPRRLYEAVGGYPAWPLFEDVEIGRRLGRGRMRRLPAEVVTSAEKFKRDGWLRRTAHNTLLVARWRLGADPAALARRYG